MSSNISDMKDCLLSTLLRLFVAYKHHFDHGTVQRVQLVFESLGSAIT